MYNSDFKFCYLAVLDKRIKMPVTVNRTEFVGICVDNKFTHTIFIELSLSYFRGIIAPPPGIQDAFLKIYKFYHFLYGIPEIFVNPSN